jgi:signal transduction histidine kinase
VDEILGRTLIEVMGVEGWEKIRPYVERVLRGEPRVEYETTLTYTTGGPRVVHVVYTPETEGEDVVGWIASVTDITEFRRVEKQLQIEKLEKLAAAGQLAASLAHEINNPLSAVVNILYLLGRSESDPASANLISTATNEIARVARIVKQSLSYYRGGTKATNIDLAALVEESLQVFSDRFQRAGIVLSETITPATTVTGFADEIRQVVDNLLVNAEEATPHGGRVIVCLRQSRSWQHHNELGARFTIADNGRGIPTAYIPKVCDPFFTTKAEKGTGLGLWVVKGVVEKHGGSIKIRSSAAPRRSGTVISIFWPKKPTGKLSQSEYAA